MDSTKSIGLTNKFSQTIQQSINTENGIDFKLLEEYLDSREMTLVNNFNNYSQIKSNQRISYVNNSELFRTGGIVMMNESDYFVIRGFNGSRFSLQKNTIDQLWVGDIKKSKSVNNSIKVYEFVKGAETKWPAMFGSEVIKYFPKEITLRRFLNTEKYRKIISGEAEFRHV